LAELRTFLADLRRAGIDVVVIDMPVSNVYVGWHPGGEATYDAATTRLDATAAAAGARVLRPGVWSERYFSDPFHLNGAGAARLTAVLARQLAG
jgi:hypothetical protein